MYENTEMGNLTVISRNNLSFLERESRTAEEIVAFIKQGAIFRSFQDVIKRLYPEDDAEERLTKGLAEITGDSGQSTARKVKNWMKGKNLPKNRETFFQICFVLELNEKQADQLLGTFADTGIHYRNPEELAVAYGLRTRKTYMETEKLRAKVLNIYKEEKDTHKDTKTMQYTRQIRDRFQYVSTEEELTGFIRENASAMGYFHETAYEKYIELLNHLLAPESYAGTEEPTISMAEVIENYLQMGVPVGRQQTNLTVLQKLVKKCWPGETELLKIRSRKEDVSRKAMILLYLVTEAFDFYESDEELDYYSPDEEEADTDEALAVRVQMMNLFLEKFGMNQLDPGNPFDFLAIYSMKPSNAEDTDWDDYAGRRMSEAVALLFESDAL